MKGMIGLLLLGLSGVVWAESGCWEKARQENGVTAYTCDLPGSDYDAVRVETVVDRSTAWLITLNTRSDELADWMASFKSVDLLEDSGWHDYFLHIRYAFPFPYDDRDSVTHSWVTRDPENGRVRLQFEAEADRIPPEQDHVRMPELRGGWTFTPTDSGQTHVVYEALVHPGGDGPAWVVNMFSLDLPVKTVEALVEQTSRELSPLRDLSEIPTQSMPEGSMLSKLRH